MGTVNGPIIVDVSQAAFQEGPGILHYAMELALFSFMSQMVTEKTLLNAREYGGL